MYAQLLRRSLLNPEATTVSRKQNFKKSLLHHYGYATPSSSTDPQFIRCMLLDIPLPSKVVIGAHLFRHSLHDIAASLLDLEDINDPRNGLLLFQPIEVAFDKFQLSFIYDKEADTFRLKLWDQALRLQLLVDSITDKNVRLRIENPDGWRRRSRPCVAKNCTLDLLTTFGDIDGKCLVFTNLTRPFKRCINLQARVAREEAVRNKWIDESDEDFEDFWSEGLSVADKLELAFRAARSL